MTATQPELTGADALQALAAEHLAGEFRIFAHLGPGAWGERFTAEDLHRQETVVLTLLPPIEGEEWKAEEQFLEGMRAASLIEHPHLAPVRAYGASGPLRWFATLASADPTLAERVAAAGPLPMPLVRRIAQQLASGLDQAHRRGITHGALTVHEVRIDAQGWVRLEEVGVGAAFGAHEEVADEVGLAELVRHCLTGGGEEAPLPADIDGAVYAAILRATRPRPNDRFRDLPEFVAALDGVTTTAQPLRPTIPVGRRIRPADWEELLETEPEAAPAPRRPLMMRAALGVALLVLVTAAVPLGRRLVRPADGRISYPSAPLVVSPVVRPAEEVAPAAEPAPPAVDATRPAPEPKRTPTPTPVRTSTSTAAPAPRGTVVRTPAPTLPDPMTLPPVPAAKGDEVPGTLSISSTPWGELSIDGTPMGNTPQLSLPLSPGRHQIRLTRDGYEPFTIEVMVRPGEAIRLTQLALKELKL